MSLMSLQRRVEPELLDQLPPSDPGAVHSRRDIRRINAMLRHAEVMARAVTRHRPHDQPSTILDLGAGDGTFMLQLARRLASRWQNVTVILLDRQDIVASETRQALAARHWKVETVTADVFDYLEKNRRSGVDIIIANLFLHHFTDEDLTRLLARAAQSASLFVSCDPRRTALVRELSRLLWAIGCNHVSIHDAVVSAAAGFNGKELSALWPKGNDWELQEHEAFPFSHCLVARRAHKE